MMKRFLATACLLAAFCLGAGAQGSVSRDYEFVQYLLGSDLAADAATLLSGKDYAPSDTLDFLKGWTLFTLKKLDEATQQFDKLRPGSPFYDRALFYNVVSNANLGRLDRSRELLDTYSGPYCEVERLERAGIALLQGSPDTYLQAAEGFSYSDFNLSGSEQALDRIYADRYLGRSKSPAVAALASTFVPGLGKIYAGRIGEGVSSFLVVGSLAGITAENWVRKGAGDWRTILFGTLGAAFYIGNIYGSYVSVSIQKNELSNAQDAAVLYHINIPLRSIFK